MTRVVKDVLRVGTWRVNKGRSVSFTRDDLAAIAASHQRQRKTGRSVNLCWGHGDETTLSVDARDLISPVDQVILSGDTLWATAYVTPEQAVDLQSPTRHVSPRVLYDFTDTNGESYDVCMAHVAIVDVPVMDSQGPFVDLAANVLELYSDTKQKEVKGMDFAKLTELINTLLKPYGVTLPEETAEDRIVEVLGIIVQMVGQLNGEPAKTEEPVTDVVNDSVSDPVLADMAARIDKLTRMVSDMGRSNADSATKTRNAKRDAFESRLDELASTGNINAATRAKWSERGPMIDFSVDFLDDLGEKRMVDMSRKAKSQAEKSQPGFGGVQSQDEVNEYLKSQGLPEVKYAEY